MASTPNCFVEYRVERSGSTVWVSAGFMTAEEAECFCRGRDAAWYRVVAYRAA